MSQLSIKRNFIYKSLLTVSSYLMGFIVFPYISRVFGVEKIGLVNFVDNTINYFLVFASLGIGILGTREIASVKNNPDKLSIIYSRLLGQNLLFTLITLIVYFILVYTIPDLRQYDKLFYIGAAKILFTAFSIEWFYTGLEEFRYITIRSIIVKTLFVIFVFSFVRAENDYVIYFIFSVAVVIVNSIINVVYANKFAHLNIRALCPTLNYTKQNIQLGIYGIMTSMYSTFNVMFLGIICDNIQVGYYTTAVKLYTIILSFFAAFTNVMLPRMSSLLNDGDESRFVELTYKSFEAMSVFSIPLIILSIIMAPQIVSILAGPGYEGAITPMRIIMPAILFVGIAQVIAIQVLLPMKKDVVLLKTSIFGAIISLICIFSLIPILGSIGSSIVLLVAEMTVTMLYIMALYRSTNIRLPWKSLLASLMKTVPGALICILILLTVKNFYASVLSAGILYFSVWYILNKDYLKRMLNLG